MAIRMRLYGDYFTKYIVYIYIYNENAVVIVNKKLIINSLA